MDRQPFDMAEWTISHFAQANPKGPDISNVPLLLRRVADSLDKLGRVEVQDITLHREITEDGEDWPSLTVYFRHLNEGDQPG
jgi:hypothetical protein